MSAARPARRSSAIAASTSGRDVVVLDGEEDVDLAALGASTPCSIERSTMRSIPLANPTRRRRRAADLLDQIVVAAAPAERGLRPERLAHELEGRARVVVEPAHEGRRQPVLDPVGVEVPADAGEVRLALLAQRLADLRRLRQRLLHAPGFWARLSNTRSGLVSPLGARLLVELVGVLVEPGVQLLEVRGAAVPVADRVQLEPPALISRRRRSSAKSWITSASTAGSSDPIASTLSCQNSRNLPRCGAE